MSRQVMVPLWKCILKKEKGSLNRKEKRGQNMGKPRIEEKKKLKSVIENVGYYIFLRKTPSDMLSKSAEGDESILYMCDINNNTRNT